MTTTVCVPLFQTTVVLFYGIFRQGSNHISMAKSGIFRFSKDSRRVALQPGYVAGVRCGCSSFIFYFKVLSMMENGENP